jgi:hypothetical protein
MVLWKYRGGGARVSEDDADAERSGKSAGLQEGGLEQGKVLKELQT